MTEICPIEECTGCGACSGVCPKECISMVASGGMKALYPVIDQSKCIDCGFCATTCPNNHPTLFQEPSAVYAAWHHDQADRNSSTSGGIGAALAEYFISIGGIVYGAVMKPGVNVEHERASSLEEIDKFKKSKYVQSTISSSLIKAIKADLKAGLQVLFTGTPCQTAGIRNATRNHPNLVCVDIICHGVPSIELLRDHVKMVFGNPDSITSLTTRDLQGYFLDLKSQGSTVYRRGFPDDAYLNGFQYALFYRDSCYRCKYARPERQSDITIGDFWGLGKTDYPHNKVSVILTNTVKGESILNEIKSTLFLDKRTLEEAVAGNSQLRHPSKSHEFHIFFKKWYPILGYAAAVRLSLIKFRIKHWMFKVLMHNKSFRNHYLNKRQ